ncbi:apoptosis-associated speck-like protein containing a CARD [Myxocyprinus asiaticus]|uniref:apoptosis-associated speck-like protein containing a CARD n=1 Tax=Myxocyprinus asiaticus TaxID=70543 RepID=UPI0022239688|nr:apoptosis-associated speck-like protein containing a CARD [Myxocyprinus asiaticus]
MDVHKILLGHLDELESEEMKTFTWHLTQGVKDFKIAKSRLEKKSRCEVLECLIEYYHPDGAAQFTQIILEKMKKNNLAKQLQEKLHVNGAEFVEKHRTDLINRVSLVEPIADDLKALIGDEKYAIILQSETSHKKMRKLLSFLTTPTLKEKLYQSLLKNEPYLVDDLENSA